MSKTKLDVCKSCFGSGYVRDCDGDRKSCDDCHGVGFVRVTMTNADRIRAMTDEELARLLYNSVDDRYCKSDPECENLLCTDEGIPEEKCVGCALRWLQQAAEEE